jgi:nitrite reductase/ring-hydroxylating ferredoxin subunit
MKLAAKISRHEFLKKMGFSGASLLALYCGASLMESCSAAKIEGNKDDFTFDISKGQFRTLQQPGGWVKVNDVVIACVASGQFAAVGSICSHEGENQVVYRPAEKDFRCTAHGAEFDLKGSGKNKKGRKGLALYEASLSGNLLRINRNTQSNNN